MLQQSSPPTVQNPPVSTTAWHGKPSKARTRSTETTIRWVQVHCLRWLSDASVAQTRDLSLDQTRRAQQTVDELIELRRKGQTSNAVPLEVIYRSPAIGVGSRSEQGKKREGSDSPGAGICNDAEPRLGRDVGEFDATGLHDLGAVDVNRDFAPLDPLGPGDHDRDRARAGCIELLLGRTEEIPGITVPPPRKVDATIARDELQLEHGPGRRIEIEETESGFGQQIGKLWADLKIVDRDASCARQQRSGEPADRILRAAEIDREIALVVVLERAGPDNPRPRRRHVVAMITADILGNSRQGARSKS